MARKEEQNPTTTTRSTVDSTAVLKGELVEHFREGRESLRGQRKPQSRDLQQRAVVD